MIVSAHLIAGGVVGEAIGNPILAFFAAILLHFILDSVPHFDTPDGGKVTWRQVVFTLSEITVGLYLIFFVIKPEISWSSPFLWGAFGGILPDLLDWLPPINILWHKTKFSKKVMIFHDKIQKVKPHWTIGLLIQAITIYIFISIHFAIK